MSDACTRAARRRRMDRIELAFEVGMWIGALLAALYVIGVGVGALNAWIHQP